MTEEEAKLWIEALIENARHSKLYSEKWKFFVDWSIDIYCEMHPLPDQLIEPHNLI